MLVAEGKTNKEIAAEVFLSDKTVKNYVSSILSKLNLERRAQAAAFVAKHRSGISDDAYDHWMPRRGHSAVADRRRRPENGPTARGADRGEFGRDAGRRRYDDADGR